MKHKSIKRRNIKFKSIRLSKRRLSKRRLSKRRLSKRRLSKRRLSKRRHTKKYRMRGGTTPLPEPVYQTVSNPLPAGDPASGQAKIEQQNAQQNQANKTLTGGKRSRGKRSRGKRSRGKRSRGISKRLLKQRGGEATICGGSPLNGADGYGYVSPNNCLLVPTVNNPAAQSLAITAMNNLNIEATNGAGDRLVGK